MAAVLTWLHVAIRYLTLKLHGPFKREPLEAHEAAPYLDFTWGGADHSASRSGAEPIGQDLAHRLFWWATLTR